MQDYDFYSVYKSARILRIYTKLIEGESINKVAEAECFQVHPKTIQRDIDEIRAFLENMLAEGESPKTLEYNRKENSYSLISTEEVLTNSEILAVCKILLESRSMCKSEMEPIIRKLVDACVPKKNRAVVKSLVANELFHYVEPHHKKKFVV